MTEHWMRSVVTGSSPAEENKAKITQEVLHRRGEDPLRMACRRDREMAGRSRFVVHSYAVFNLGIKEDHGYQHRAEIPRDDGKQYEEWQW